jgi:hypothetical protein
LWIRTGLLIGVIACLYLSPIGDPARIWFRSQVGDPIQILLRKNSYYGFIEKDRPFLGRLASSARFTRKVELFSEDGRLYPYVFYDVVYGDADGILECAYVVDLEKSFSPKGIKQENFSVRLLPAYEQVNIKGRIRNIYWGRYIEPQKAAAVADRVCSGDRLLDIKESIERHPDFPDLCWADTDPWVKLTGNRKNEAIDSAKGRQLSDKDICEIKATVEKLKPGLTMPEVRAVLENTRFWTSTTPGISHGPSTARGTGYQLRGDCGLELVYSYTTSPPRLVSALISANCCTSNWP